MASEPLHRISVDEDRLDDVLELPTIDCTLALRDPYDRVIP